MMFGIVILVVSVLASTGTGVFVFARNPRSVVNRVYGILTLSLIVLSIANYFSLATTNRLIFIRIVIACSNILVSSLYYLIFYLGTENSRLTRWQRIGILFTLGLVTLDFTPLVFSGLQGTTNPTPVPNFGAGFFLAHLIIFLSCGAWLLYRRIRASRGVLRMQYVYMLTGLSPILLFSPVTGFVLPILLKKTDFIAITPLYGAFFVCLIGYSIVRHKLFDIQFFVVRAAAYVTTLFAVTFIFVTPFVVGVSYLLGSRLSFEQLSLIILTSVIFIYVLQALRRFFDRLTGAIFFRHYYDPQDVLDKLSDILVRTSDLQDLQRLTIGIIEDTLRPQQLRYLLFADLVSKEKGLAEMLKTFAKNEAYN